jgi:G3E family GTPase
VIEARFGKVDADELLGVRTGTPATERWHLPSASSAPEHGHDHGHAHDHGHGDDAHAHHGSDPNRHDHGIRATSILRDAPLPWDGLAAWLRSLLSLRGANVLRLKGVVSVTGCDQPVVLHAIHHLLHPPKLMGQWPEGPRTSRIVVIGRDIDPADVTAAFDTFVRKAAGG